MDKPAPDFIFNMMCLALRTRAFFSSPKDVLREAGIEPGSQVLDYGCGPGSYLPGIAELVGESGKIYTLDIHPLAVQRIRDIAAKTGLVNVETVCSDCKTGLPDGSIDVVLLYDIFHMLSAPDAVLSELHRVLRRDGILSFNDHHMGEDDILEGVTGSHLFRLSKKGEKTYSFVKQER